jgi:hypothetical protein
MTIASLPSMIILRSGVVKSRVARRQAREEIATLRAWPVLPEGMSVPFAMPRFRPVDGVWQREKEIPVRSSISLFVVAGLAWALAGEEPARAGWFGHGGQFACDRPVYPKHHYWTPALERWRNALRGYGVGCQHLYPHIPGEVHIFTFPCQDADPAAIPYGLGTAPRDVIPTHPYGTIPPGSK